MKGLLMKDLLWLRQQKKMFLIVLILLMLYLFIQMYSFMAVFFPGWMLLVCTRTILMDLDGSSSRFLFTLPFDRKQYAAEKYILSLGACLLVLLLVTGVGLLFGQTQDRDMLLACLQGLPVALCLMCSVIIPLSIRFKNNASLIMMLSGVGIFPILFLLQDWMGENSLPVPGTGTWFPYALLAVSILILGLSWKLSVIFLNREEL